MLLTGIVLRHNRHALGAVGRQIHIFHRNYAVRESESGFKGARQAGLYTLLHDETVYYDFDIMLFLGIELGSIRKVIQLAVYLRTGEAVGYGVGYGGGTTARVAHYVHIAVFLVALLVGIGSYAIPAKQIQVYLLAYGGDYGIRVHLNGLAGLHGYAAAGSVLIAQLHLIANELAGETSSMNSTPSSMASSSSSRSAGIYLRLRRYTSVTFSTPSARFAARAASIAVLPPPTTATFLPSFSSPPFLSGTIRVSRV